MQAVVFDMDGVIFDSEALCLACWTEIAKNENLTNMEEAFHKCIGTTVVETKRIMLEAFGEDFDYDHCAKLASDMFHEKEMTSGLPVKKGAREILAYLHEKKIPIGLASSTRLETVTRQLKSAGLYDYFTVVIGGDLLKKSKPEPDIYLMACEKLELLPAEAFAIEDSYNGIRSAYRAGMKPLMVPDMLEANEEMKKMSQVFTDLFEVRKYLEEVFER